MLAKMWKKILLAVCIIACMYNVMSKLVNRHSLESNLKTADDGTTVLEAIKDNEEKNQSNKSDSNNEDGYINNSDNSDNNSNEKNKQESNIEDKNQKENNEDLEIDLTNTQELWDSSPKEVYRYKDYVVTF